MTIYLLSPNSSNEQAQAIEARLQELVSDIQKISNVESIAGLLREKTEKQVIVVYVAPDISPEGIENLIGISRRYNQRVFFILVSNEISATNYKHLVQSGGADWVAANGPLAEVSEIITKQSAPKNHVAASDVEGPTVEGPAVVTFLPCMGGVGNTTIALETALQIAQSRTPRSWKTCYIDMDFQTSHVCDYLDIEPRLQIDEISDKPERLDEQLFELFVSHHSSGLDVFAAPRQKLDLCGLNLAALDKLLEMVSRRYDFLIVDLPVAWLPWTVPTIEASNLIVLSGINTVPALRQMKATLDAVVEAKASKTALVIVINRVTRGIFGGVKRHSHVESVFENEKLFYIDEDPNAIARVNTGNPAGLGGPAKYLKEIRRLSQFCLDMKHPAARDRKAR